MMVIIARQKYKIALETLFLPSASTFSWKWLIDFDKRLFEYFLRWYVLLITTYCTLINVNGKYSEKNTHIKVWCVFSITKSNYGYDKVAFRVIFIYTLHNVRFIIFLLFFSLNTFCLFFIGKIPNSNESAKSDEYRREWVHRRTCTIYRMLMIFFRLF